LYLRRHHIATMLKNYSLPNIFRYTLPFLAMMLIVATKWSLSGERIKARAYYSAFLWVFSHIDLIVRKRMFVQKIRKTPDKELMRMMKHPAIKLI
ncbi:MAG: hypothetical protein FGF50_09560, partial [Candidatus Brockarchaeota archaeon]|nr:hypothetical protein [Candidatus Brockarchaeota archaeon]